MIAIKCQLPKGARYRQGKLPYLDVIEQCLTSTDEGVVIANQPLDGPIWASYNDGRLSGLRVRPAVRDCTGEALSPYANVILNSDDGLVHNSMQFTHDFREYLAGRYPADYFLYGVLVRPTFLALYYANPDRTGYEIINIREFPEPILITMPDCSPSKVKILAQDGRKEMWINCRRTSQILARYDADTTRMSLRMGKSLKEVEQSGLPLPQLPEDWEYGLDLIKDGKSTIVQRIYRHNDLNAISVGELLTYDCQRQCYYV